MQLSFSRENLYLDVKEFQGHKYRARAVEWHILGDEVLAQTIYLHWRLRVQSRVTECTAAEYKL